MSILSLKIEAGQWVSMLNFLNIFKVFVFLPFGKAGGEGYRLFSPCFFDSF